MSNILHFGNKICPEHHDHVQSSLVSLCLGDKSFETPRQEDTKIFSGIDKSLFFNLIRDNY